MVSSLSPRKMELAPARKHSACASWDIAVRPALRRTIAFGSSTRVAAILFMVLSGRAAIATYCNSNANRTNAAVPLRPVDMAGIGRSYGTGSCLPIPCVQVAKIEGARPWPARSTT